MKKEIELIEFNLTYGMSKELIKFNNLVIRKGLREYAGFRPSLINSEHVMPYNLKTS